MKIVIKSPGSSKIGRGLGTFPAEIPTTAKPNHRLRPSFLRNPLVPFLPLSDPFTGTLKRPRQKENS